MLQKMLLRQQMIVLRRQVKFPRLTWRDRTFLVLLSSRLVVTRKTIISSRRVVDGSFRPGQLEEGIIGRGIGD
ncbi:MAG: hypothetical protein P8189_07125 [Anaerolineae bacterium]|jgi:hypothetical protein